MLNICSISHCNSFLINLLIAKIFSLMICSLIFVALLISRSDAFERFGCNKGLDVIGSSRGGAVG